MKSLLIGCLMLVSFAQAQDKATFQEFVFPAQQDYKINEASLVIDSSANVQLKYPENSSLSVSSDSFVWDLCEGQKQSVSWKIGQTASFVTTDNYKGAECSSPLKQTADQVAKNLNKAGPQQMQAAKIKAFDKNWLVTALAGSSD